MQEKVNDLLGIGTVKDALSSLIINTEKKENVNGKSSKKRKRKAPQFPRKWVPSDDYELFRKGVVLKKHPDEVISMLNPRTPFLFRHKVEKETGQDIVAFGESKDRPLWYAVFKLAHYPEGVYFLPTQDQEKAMYQKMLMKNIPKGFHMEDGTPYWPDSYYHKKGRERKNKSRHTAKVNAKKKRKKLLSTRADKSDMKTVFGEQEAEVVLDIVISGGLPIDSSMFFPISLKVRRTLKKNGMFDEIKVAKSTKATSSIAKEIGSMVPTLMSSLFCQKSTNDEPKKGDNEVDSTPKAKKIKVDLQKNVLGKQVADAGEISFTSPAWVKRLGPKDTVPKDISDYIEQQFQFTKIGQIGLCSDAMRVNYKEYKKSSNPVRKVMQNATGDLLLSFYFFVTKKMKTSISQTNIGTPPQTYENKSIK